MHAAFDCKLPSFLPLLDLLLEGRKEGRKKERKEVVSHNGIQG